MTDARSAPPEGGRRGRTRTWLLLLMAVLGVFAALGLGRFGYTALLPAMQDGLGLSNTQAGALASWNLAGYLAMAAVVGSLIQRFGLRRVVTVGLMVTATAMIATGFAQGVVSASLARAAAGLGAGAVSIPMTSAVGGWVAEHRRGLASGIAVSGSAVALVLTGPFVPAVIAATGEAGWRICWIIFGVTALAVAVASFVVLRGRPRDEGEASAEGSSRRRLDVGSVYRSPYAWRLGAVYFAYGFSYMIYLTFFVRRLTGDLGMSGASAGTYFMILGWASLLCGAMWGYVSDLIGRKRALVVICVLLAVTFASFAVWTTPVGIAFSTVLFGLAAWAAPGVVVAACGDAFGRALAATAVGFLTVFLGVGQVVGPLVGGMLADALSSFSSAYLAAAVVALAGAVAALLLPTVASGVVSGSPARREEVARGLAADGSGQTSTGV